MTRPRRRVNADERLATGCAIIVIGLVVLVIAAKTLAHQASGADRAEAKPEPEPPPDVVVYTIPNCLHCERLKAAVKRGDYRPLKVTFYEFQGFPTLVSGEDVKEGYGDETRRWLKSLAREKGRAK